MMAASDLLRVLCWCGAVGLLAAARYPAGDTLSDAAALGAAGAAAISGIASRWPARLRPLDFIAFVSMLGLLVVPTAAATALVDVHPAVGALAALLGLHVFFRHDAGRAPVLATGRQNHHTLQAVVRYVPAAAVIALIIALPRLYPFFLEPRVYSTWEFQSAIAPLLPLLAVLPIVLLLGSIRSVHAAKHQVVRNDGAEGRASAGSGVDSP